MAGMSQKQELQNAHSTKFLNYGHLGTVTYDEGGKRWGTLRIVEPHVAAAHHTDTKNDGRTAFPLRHLSSSVVPDGLTAPQHQFQSDANHHDLDGTDESNSEPTRKSHSSGKTEDKSGNNERFESDASTFAEKQSPNRSTLLAFGSAVSATVKGVCSEPVHITIAAIVSGSDAQNFRLVRIGRQTIENLDFDGDDAFRQVPCISNENQTYWISNGGPIQQVCFAAAAGYPSTWMAARLQGSTIIFHPLLHQGPVPPRCGTSQSPSQVLPSSVLNANPIVTIPISRTGGHPHADVNFHPQEHLKLALIDEHGNWSVWLVDGERQEGPRSRFWVTLICFGKLWTWNYEKRLRASLPYHDGWHRISWYVRSGTQSDELLICNRRTAAVYTTSGVLVGLKDLRLGHARENQLILDVQWSSFVPGHCFVLTSTRMFWLYFMDTRSGRSGRDKDTSHVLLAWQHFRDRGDRTLRLVLLETATVVLIVSRLVDLVLVFRVGLANGDKGLPVSLADPLPLLLPEHPNHVESRRRPSSLLFRAIESIQEVGGTERIEKPCLFKLFSLYEDLTIAEHLYSSTEPGFGPIAGAAPSSILQLPKCPSRRQLSSKPPNQGALKDFVVPDDLVRWNECSTGNKYDRILGDPKSRRLSTRARPNFDWQDVYNRVTKEGDDSSLNARIKMDAFLSRLSDHLHQAKLSNMALLSEVLSCKLHIGDVDGDSENFECSTSTFNLQQDRGKKLERLPMVTSDGQLPGGLSSVYDAIVASHLTPLSPHIPDRGRLNKERLARRVSADLLLASTAIYPLSTTPSDAINGGTLMKRETSQPTPYSSSTVQSSRPASIPTNTTPTTATTAEDDPLLTRLRKYTTISPISSPIINNPALTSLLRHLPTSPHANPKTYKYRVTERALAAEHEEELAIAAGIADPRARRKAEKARAARVRREEVRRRAAEEVASSQRAPPRVISSQVVSSQGGGFGLGLGEDGRQVQSSQVKGTVWDGGAGPSQGHRFGQGTQMPMTQPERGDFGTRRGVGIGIGQRKDQGKKRAAGF